MLDVDGRFFSAGTPGPRDWVPDLAAEPRLVVHMKRHAGVDPATRRRLLEHPIAWWYRDQEPLDVPDATAPMANIAFVGAAS